MLLDTYFKLKGETDQTFAAKIARERSFVTRLRNGDTAASFETVQRVEKVTGGQVTAADLYAMRAANLKKKPARRKHRRAPQHIAAE